MIRPIMYNTIIILEERLGVTFCLNRAKGKIPFEGDVLGIQVGVHDRRGQTLGHLLLGGLHGIQRDLLYLLGDVEALRVHHFIVVIHLHQFCTCICNTGRWRQKRKIKTTKKSDRIKV